MNTKLKVITNCDDKQHNDWKKGEKGFVDGFMRGGDDTPNAVVVIKKRIVLIPLHCINVQ